MLFKRADARDADGAARVTVGLWVAIPAIARLVFPFASTEIFNPKGRGSSPADPNFLKVFGTYVNENQFVVIVSAVVIVGGDAGAAPHPPRAGDAHDGRSSAKAGIAGVNTEAVTAGSWMVGVMLAGFAGALLAPIRGPGREPVPVPARRLVRRGRHRADDQLPLAFAGAIAVGLLQQLWVKAQPESGFFSLGVSASIPFVVMLVFLIAYSFSAKGLRTEAFEVDRRSGGRGARRRAAAATRTAAGARLGRWAMAVVLVGAAAAVRQRHSSRDHLRPVLGGGVRVGDRAAIVHLFYTLVTGEGGLISPAQITLAGIGAFAAARPRGRGGLAGVAGDPPALGVRGAVRAAGRARPSLRIGDLSHLAPLTIGFAFAFGAVRRDSGNEYENFGARRADRAAVRHPASPTWSGDVRDRRGGRRSRDRRGPGS